MSENYSLGLKTVWIAYVSLENRPHELLQIDLHNCKRASSLVSLRITQKHQSLNFLSPTEGSGKLRHLLKPPHLKRRI